MDPADFLRLALDPVRLSLLGRAAEGRIDVAEVAAALHVPERTVLEALGRLRSAGLLAGDRLDRNALREVAAALPREPAADPELAGGDWSEEEATVLSRFFSGRRLTSIPANQQKRILVLERLAQEFEPGVLYSEPEVNFKLQLFHADYATLRRYLVDHDLLAREAGVYWRTGGRYQIDATPGGDEPGTG